MNGTDVQWKRQPPRCNHLHSAVFGNGSAGGDGSRKENVVQEGRPVQEKRKTEN
jgi:hypothetical protein